MRKVTFFLFLEMSIPSRGVYAKVGPDPFWPDVPVSSLSFPEQNERVIWMSIISGGKPLPAWAPYIPKTDEQKQPDVDIPTGAKFTDLEEISDAMMNRIVPTSMLSDQQQEEFDAISEFRGRVLEMASSSSSGGILSGLNNVVERLEEFATTVVGEVGDTVRSIGEDITEDIGFVVEGLTEDISVVGNTVQSLGDTIGDTVQALGDDITNDIRLIGDDITNDITAVGDTFQAISDDISNDIMAIGDDITNDISLVTDGLSDNIDRIGDLIEDISADITTDVESVTGTVKTVAETAGISTAVIFGLGILGVLFLLRDPEANKEVLLGAQKMTTEQIVIVADTAKALTPQVGIGGANVTL
jgi:archaellum component FlaC